MMLPIFIPFNNNTIKEEKVVIKPSYTETYTNVPWINNSQFDDPIEELWYPIIQGDGSDVYTSTSSNQADITVVGESRERKKFSSIQPLNQIGWLFLRATWKLYLKSLLFHNMG